MLQKHHRLGYALLILLFAVWARPLPAQLDADSMRGPGGKKPKEKTIYPFDRSDMVRAYIGPIKGHYFVGEPIVLPLVLINHTRFPITVLTNFFPRSSLKVMIRPEGQAQYRYNGPYMKGFYGPSPIKMYPFDEMHVNLILWADVEMPGYLAFDKPGLYTINVSLQFTVDEGNNVGGELPIDPNPFTVNIEPTPKELEPLIGMLRKDGNVNFLQLHLNPPSWGPDTLNILKQFPQTVFTPYLCYALASYYAFQYENKPTEESGDSAIYFYQAAALSDSPFREEIYGDLLRFLDKLQLANPASKVAREMLSKMPEDRFGKIGNLPMLKKYLINTEELDPEKYWAFLP